MKKNIFILSLLLISVLSFSQEIYEGYPYNPANPGDPSDPGQPWPVPCVIYAVFFDEGGEAVAYHDISTDIPNAGGANFRNEHIGIEACSLSDDGIDANVCYTTGEEWMNYTVSVENSGKYDIYFTLATGGNPGKFSLSIDGKDISGKLIVPVTGGWQTWKNDIVLQDIEMTEGEHIVTFHTIHGGFNFYKMQFVEAGEYQGEPYDGTPHPVPGTIEAEYFDTGGPGIAYLDQSEHVPNTDVNFREELVGIEQGNASSNNFYVCYTEGGEKLNYTIEAVEGIYDVIFTVATGDGDGKFYFTIDNEEPRPVEFMTTGGWEEQHWATVRLSRVSLSAGEHIVKLVTNIGNYNLDKFEFEENTGNALPGISRESSNAWIENGTLHLKGYSPAATVEIYDLHGRKIPTATLGNPLTHLPSGIYAVKVQDEGKTAVHKIRIK
jgi:hypothetical protein